MKTNNPIVYLIIFFILLNSINAKPGKVVAGYYPHYRTTMYPPSSIPMEGLTHIMHSFAWPDKQGNVVTPQNFFGPVPDLIDLAHDADTKVILSLGGGGSGEDFDDMAADSAARSNFIDQITTICLDYGYDGIDIDWEQPDTQQDKQNLKKLVKEFQEFWDDYGDEYTISIAVPLSSWRGDFYDASFLKNYVQWFGVMTYDMHGPWSGHTGYNSALWSDPSDPDQLSINSAIKNYWHGQKGVPYDQLLCGIPFYGYKFDGADAPYESFTSATALTYTGIKALPGYTEHWSMVSKVPYLSTTESGGSFISYEDTVSVRHKCEYAIEKGLAGVMIWELAQTYFDDENQPLLEAVIKTMERTTSVYEPLTEQIPNKFQLHQNYPNPFNPSTTIPLSIPKASQVKIDIYNIRGEKVIELADKFMNPGNHYFHWTPVDRYNNILPNGIYIIKMSASQYHKTIKCALIK